MPDERRKVVSCGTNQTAPPCIRRNAAMQYKPYGVAAQGGIKGKDADGVGSDVCKRRSAMLLWGFLARQFKRWQVYNQTVAELSQLDDRSLADINVSRSEIRSVARHASGAA